VGDPLEGLAEGKLLFELRGYKLRGLWTLVKLKKSEKDWLLIKERDTWASKDSEELPPESVLSGLTVEDLGAAAIARGHPARAHTARRAAASGRGEVGRPHARRDGGAGVLAEGWLFEPKLDGYRVLAARAPSEPRLLTRNGTTAPPAFRRFSARSPRFRSSVWCSTGKSSRSMTRAAPAFNDCRGAPGCGDRSTSATRQSTLPSPTTPSTSSASRLRSAARSHSRAQGGASAGPASGRPAALPGARG